MLLLLGCEEIKKPLTCSPYTVYKVARGCEKNLLKAFLVDKGKPDCGLELRISLFFSLLNALVRPINS